MEPNANWPIYCVACIFAFVGGCKDEEGPVGISFPGGVQCLGEEAMLIDGDTVFVSPDGDDENAGNSPTKPKATLATVLCNLRPE